MCTFLEVSRHVALHVIINLIIILLRFCKIFSAGPSLSLDNLLVSYVMAAAEVLQVNLPYS
jgi:hypothetical protein